MGVLTLKCSTTGREFFTDIDIDEDSFGNPPDTVDKTRCPYCGREARWVNSVQPRLVRAAESSLF